MKVVQLIIKIADYHHYFWLVNHHGNRIWMLARRRQETRLRWDTMKRRRRERMCLNSCFTNFCGVYYKKFCLLSTLRDFTQLWCFCSFSKQIRYASRKARADTRKRVKGRFVKAGEAYDYDPLLSSNFWARLPNLLSLSLQENTEK